MQLLSLFNPISVSACFIYSQQWNFLKDARVANNRNVFKIHEDGELNSNIAKNPSTKNILSELKS